MTKDEAIAIARDWRDHAVAHPEKIGVALPDSPQISYEVLDILLAAIDGTEPVGVIMPVRQRGSGSIGCKAAA